jgi:Cellulase (glycosyl hydrolase family 5)
MKTNLKVRVFPLILSFFFQNGYAFDNISLTEPALLFSVSDKTVPIVSVSYVAWDTDATGAWKWAGTTISPNITVEGGNVSGSFAGQVSNLGVDFTGSVAALPSTNQISWTYNWQLSQDHLKAVGLGLEFNFNTLSSSFLTAATPPVLLPGNEGWRWNTPEGSIEVKFTPALAGLGFEGQGQNKIRAYFFTAINSAVKPPPTTMTVTIDRNIALSAPVSFSYDTIDPLVPWPQSTLPDSQSPYDLSFLNSNDIPAGKHGFLKASADKLVFEDGTPAKFWGANLMANAIFTTTDANIAKHAKRIAQLGFNLVRIHHHDTQWVNPNIFVRDAAKNTLELSPTSLKKLDLWIKSLRAEGVYLWLDLHVERNFTANDFSITDQVTDTITNGVLYFKDFAKGQVRAQAKGFNYFNASIQDRMQQFNEKYLNHINPQTGLAYKNDPAIIGLLLTNENDLTTHYGNSLLGSNKVPLHTAIFKQEGKQFASRNSFVLSKTLATWIRGESKLFMSDMEHRFNQKMRDHLDILGVKSLVATTNSWGKMGLNGLPSMTDGDVIDVHSYGKDEELNRDPRYNPGFLSWIAGAQVSGKPLTVTEWNIGSFPGRDRFTAPLFTASLASLQGWDAMMLYGYSQSDLNGTIVNGSNYSSFNDPALMGIMPAAALLYRQDHVALAKQSYELKLGRNDIFFKKIDPTTSKTIRTLLETSRLTIAMPDTDTPELPWLKNQVVNSTVITDPNRDYTIPVGATGLSSDTNELKRDWQAGIHTIDTAKSKIASGWIGGKPINLGDVSFNLTTKKAVVAVQSLVNSPITQSSKIFITAMARCMPITGIKLPYLCEPVAGTVTFSAPPGLSLYKVTKTGAEALTSAATYNALNGKYTVDLKAGHWFVLR